ncbi:MAG: type IV pilus assembly protein PilM [Candidatus Sungbacteria bacterium]|nr:type IV pilus assembly protein PilM [Candidatus Sungbacteria bacterium]
MRISQFIEQYVGPMVRLPIAGLDISDVSVKYLAFDPKIKKGVHGLAASGEFSVPEGIIVKGEIQKEKEDELSRIFSEWRAGEKRIPRSSFFVVSLPEEKSFLRVIQLPQMKEEEVEHAIRWEIEANIPLAFDELIYDYEIIVPPDRAKQTDHLDVAVTAFPKSLIEGYVRVLHRAGLSLAALELESQAITRSVVPDFADNISRIIVDIGRTRTSFIVCVGGAIVFTTTIELGGQLFEEHLAKAFHISPQEARLIKIETGLNRKERNGAVFDALLPIMAVLGDELKRVVAYYSHHAEHMHGASDAVQSIMLVGGDASLFGLETYLSQAVRLPVRLADPLVAAYPRHLFAVPPLRRNESLAFATTIGLALRSLRTS